MIEIIFYFDANILNNMCLFSVLGVGKNALIKSKACDTFLHLFEFETSI